ncbi:NAD-glutamate dehydrogenase [Nesterenkonia lacusekhoensis]
MRKEQAHMPGEKTLWTADDDSLDDLTEAYYAHIAREDLWSVSGQEQVERVRAHVELAASRTSSEPRAAVVTVGRRSIVLVVTDDMPYLVDSVTAEVTRNGYAMSLVVHPVLLTSRSRDTRSLLAVKSVPAPERGLSSGDTQTLPDISALLADENRTALESWIAVELDQELDEQASAQVVEGLYRVLEDVKSSHRDQERMAARSRGAAGLLREAEDLVDSDEAADLLDWMADGNFLFLGYREYEFSTAEDPSGSWEPVAGTGLGVLAERSGQGALERAAESVAAAPGRRPEERNGLVITKANARSTVRRRTYMDYVAVKTYGPDGSVRGERRFVGLFSQSAYTQSIINIPLLRHRARQLLERSGFSADSHSGSDLLQILETYPRNELLQMSIEEIEEIAWQILQLQERRRIKLFLRKDLYGRFMTALVYLPRDRYNTAVRRRVEQELMRFIDADSIDFNVRLTESVLARVFFRIRLRQDEHSGAMEISEDELQRRLERTIRSWSEGIAQEAQDRYSADAAQRIAARWGEAFPDDYRVLYEIPDALGDIAQFEMLEGQGAQQRTPNGSPVPRMQFYPPQQPGDVAHMRVKLYLTEPKTLSETLPVLDDFGLSILDERSYVLSCADGTTFHLYDLGLCYSEGVDPHTTIDLFREAYTAVLAGTAESDIFSRLVLRLGLGIHDVIVLRAYAHYMRQLGISHSYDFLAEALLQNPEVTRALISCFRVRFDPSPELEEGQDRAAAMEQARTAVKDALEAVPTLDADRVLSTFLNLIESTQRTNAYQGHGWLSLKLTPATIDAAPQPRPAHEVWVYSPQVEGVHLRFDKVARGGLRWSDRQEDFRTEVLGLVKAQMVKNSVIVPSGAKGGFYAKQLPDPAQDRGAWFEAGRAAYQIFIRGLLDITDQQVTRDPQNPEGASGDEGAQQDGAIQIVPPRDVVRHDGDDAYLVVAADKGTATFSDTANAISLEYGHWLGDAFASGGSVGYDHKAMGITARGAWESVKSHFAELGIDTQNEEFTVVAVGDMGGDVFGNGMLLSEHIRLVAAFNHLHIFIDPDPDAAASYAERQRLFTASRSGWDAYDTSLISEGGGVFSRTAKSIEITPQMRRRFDLPEGTEAMSPPELLNAVLRSPVDLFYNGGIGTYVKSSEESHEEVGDRANNAIRVDGRQLRAKVVGEGGNLGLTQAGRIEAAQHGVLLNTDAIDNSAGVDSSDHEVNIKIMLDQLITSGHLPEEERTELLKSMTEDVAQHVLQTNKDQNVLLLTERQRLGEWSPSFKRLMRWLEESAGLDRELEVLPTETELERRHEAGERTLTAPELAVLTAYAKIQLKVALVDSALPDDEWFTTTLEGYFPGQLTDRFAEQLPWHPLQREIIANVVANDVINMGGAAFVFRAMEETFAAEEQVVRAFVVVRELFRLDEFDAAMRDLPVSFPRDRWALIYLDMRRLLDRAVRWVVSHTAAGSESARGTTVRQDVETFSAHISSLYGNLAEHLRGADRARVESKREEALAAGMDDQLASWVSELFEAFSLLDIALLAREHDCPADEVAGVYYAVYAEFQVDSLLDRITRLSRLDKWQALARGAQRDELYYAVREITESVLRTTEPGDPGQRLEEWKQASHAKLDRAERLMAEVDELDADNIASLTVLLRHLRGLVGS